MTQETIKPTLRLNPLDPFFQVALFTSTPRPQAVTYAAMHQCYSENFVVEEPFIHEIDEQKAGEIITTRLLKKLHFGPFEHAQITFNVGYFPHSVMQQARTHRVACSFDVQSGRYTSERIMKVARGELDVEKVFYLRPVGIYTDRQGGRYEYTLTDRKCHLSKIRLAASTYYDDVLHRGMSEEHARGLLPFDIRQHFMVSFNIRSLMHFMDMRFPRDAQLEIQQLCNLMWIHFESWVPAVANWYEVNRKGKNKLAP